MPAAPKYAFTVKAVPLWLTVLVILLLPLVAPELSKTGMIPFLQGRRSKMWKSPAQTRACPLGGSAARAQAAPLRKRSGGGRGKQEGRVELRRLGTSHRELRDSLFFGSPLATAQVPRS